MKKSVVVGIYITACAPVLCSGNMFKYDDDPPPVPATVTPQKPAAQLPTTPPSSGQMPEGGEPSDRAGSTRKIVVSPTSDGDETDLGKSVVVRQAEVPTNAAIMAGFFPECTFDKLIQDNVRQGYSLTADNVIPISFFVKVDEAKFAIRREWLALCLSEDRLRRAQISQTFNPQEFCTDVLAQEKAQRVAQKAFLDGAGTEDVVKAITIPDSPPDYAEAMIARLAMARTNALCDELGDSGDPLRGLALRAENFFALGTLTRKTCLRAMRKSSDQELGKNGGFGLEDPDIMNFYVYLMVTREWSALANEISGLINDMGDAAELKPVVSTLKQEMNFALMLEAFRKTKDRRVGALKATTTYRQTNPLKLGILNDEHPLMRRWAKT